MADLKNSIDIAGSGMLAQTTRLRVISQNIANASTTGETPGSDPYRRQTITFRNMLDKELGVELLEIGKVQKDPSEFGLVFDPNHPAANEEGYVKTPNVDITLETADLRQAQRSYQSNLAVIQTTQRMLQSTLDILR